MSTGSLVGTKERAVLPLDLAGESGAGVGAGETQAQGRESGEEEVKLLL